MLIARKWKLDVSNWRIPLQASLTDLFTSRQEDNADRENSPSSRQSSGQFPTERGIGPASLLVKGFLARSNQSQTDIIGILIIVPSKMLFKTQRDLIAAVIVNFRLLTFCYLAALNCWLLLCPAILSHDWQMGSVPLVTSFTDTRNLATCIFFGGCLVLTYKAFTDFEVNI